MLPLDLLNDLRVGESDGLRGTDVCASGASDHAVVLPLRPCLVIADVIDAASAGNKAELAADALVMVDRGKPRDGVTGDAVPQGELSGWCFHGNGWVDLETAG